MPPTPRPAGSTKSGIRPARRIPPRESTEQLGKAAVIGRRHLKKRLRDGLGLVDKAVAHEPCRGYGAVVRPHRAVVVAHRVVRTHRTRQGPDAPAREHLLRHEVRGDRCGVGLFDDAGPQAMADVRCQGVDRALLTVETDGDVASIGEPKTLVESPPQAPRPFFEPPRRIAVAPGSRDAGPGAIGGIHITLNLAERDRRLGNSAVGEADPVGGVLPSLVYEAAIRSRAGTRRNRRHPGRRTPRSSRAPGRRAAAGGRRSRGRLPSCAVHRGA